MLDRIVKSVWPRLNEVWIVIFDILSTNSILYRGCRFEYIWILYKYLWRIIKQSKKSWPWTIINSQRTLFLKINNQISGFFQCNFLKGLWFQSSCDWKSSFLIWFNVYHIVSLKLAYEFAINTHTLDVTFVNYVVQVAKNTISFFVSITYR